jgi:hypothetical protein
MVGLDETQQGTAVRQLPDFYRKPLTRSSRAQRQNWLPVQLTVIMGVEQHNALPFAQAFCSTH